jgi:hypothetical protein
LDQNPHYGLAFLIKFGGILAKFKQTKGAIYKSA